MRRFFHEERTIATTKTQPGKKDGPTLAILSYCRSSHALFHCFQVRSHVWRIACFQALSRQPRDLEQPLGRILSIREVLQEPF